MRTAIPLAVLATALACSLVSAPAHARARVFVASYGNDANPCTFGSPCKTFQHAHDVVDAGGEVTAIDSAGFGPISINKAVTITSPNGVEAGIVPTAGGDAIDINAGASDTIILNGLTIDGSGTGQNGINFMSGGALRVQNSFIHGFAVAGLLFAPTASGALFVSNTLVSDSAYGIRVLPTGTAATATASISRSELANNGTGFSADGSATDSGSPRAVDATITDTVVTNNSNIGVVAISTPGAANIGIINSAITYNSTGIFTAKQVNNGIGSVINISTTIIRGNSTSLFSCPICEINSYGNNVIEFNTAQLLPSLSVSLH
jgi:hypothetical protein